MATSDLYYYIQRVSDGYVLNGQGNDPNRFSGTATWSPFNPSTAFRVPVGWNNNYQAQNQIIAGYIDQLPTGAGAWQRVLYRVLPLWAN